MPRLDRTFSADTFSTALQPVIFNLHVSMALRSEAEKVLRALRRWLGWWTTQVGMLQEEGRRWLGVAQHTAGLAYLTRRIVEVATSSEAATSPYLRRIPSTSQEDLHRFLQDFVAQSRQISNTSAPEQLS